MIPPRRSLRDLAAEVAEVIGLDPTGIDRLPRSVEVAGVEHDSRRVEPGQVFCCLRGTTTDGHLHAGSAVERGAVAVVVDHPLGLGVPELVVSDTRVAMAQLAAAFWGRPSRDLDVVGVTGTNGKTTVVHLVAGICAHAGRRAATIGTLTGTRTTPEATDLQAELAARRDEGVVAVAMEVSSHALAQHRVDGTWFRVGIFTNLSRDHLDYHGTMEAYFRAKARLFEPDLVELAVIDVDSTHGRLLADSARVPVVRVGLDDVDIAAIGIESSRFRWRDQEVTLGLGGRFNIRNALVAAEAAVRLGIPVPEVAAGLSSVGPVPGRFERVDVGQPYGIVVDYAHTPDGLAQLLASGREVATGRIVLVFGCGGDRDPSKRPEMGRLAAEGADVVVVTSDNPRSEDPGAIIGAVVAGMPSPPAVVEPDRRSAIRAGLAHARPGDLVLVAGKGHETTQTVGQRILPFDDRQVAAEEAAALLQRGATTDGEESGRMDR